MEASKSLIIIPAAGFGTRMGMKPNQSKELLPDPVNNEPIIEWHLEKLGKRDVHIITRAEKQDLIDYIFEKGLSTSIQIIEPKGEWASTVLESQKVWNEDNILVLPDTRWTLNEGTLPEDIYPMIEKELETHDLVFAVHKVDDCRLWGKIQLDPFTKKPLATVEKEDIAFKLEGLAWGLIGFKSKVGAELFQAYTEKGKWFRFPKNWKVKIIELESFKDITRTGKIK